MKTTWEASLKKHFAGEAVKWLQNKLISGFPPLTRNYFYLREGKLPMVNEISGLSELLRTLAIRGGRGGFNITYLFSTPQEEAKTGEDVRVYLQGQPIVLQGKTGHPTIVGAYYDLNEVSLLNQDLLLKKRELEGESVWYVFLPPLREDHIVEGSVDLWPQTTLVRPMEIPKLTHPSTPFTVHLDVIARTWWIEQRQHKSMPVPIPEPDHPFLPYLFDI